MALHKAAVDTVAALLADGARLDVRHRDLLRRTALQKLDIRALRGPAFEEIRELLTRLLVGAGVLAGMLWEPQVEGRNAHADQWTIYFHDPFLAYAYLGSLPFFFGLYQAFQLLGYVARDQAFSPAAVQALQYIKYCALAVIGFIIGGEVYIVLGVSGDQAGGVMMGVVMSFACVVTATIAAVLERLFRSAVQLKSENDLTV